MAVPRRSFLVHLCNNMFLESVGQGADIFNIGKACWNKHSNVAQNPRLKAICEFISFTDFDAQVHTFLQASSPPFLLKASSCLERLLDAPHLLHMTTHTDGWLAYGHIEVTFTTPSQDRGCNGCKFSKLVTALFSTSFWKFDCTFVFTNACFGKSIFETKCKLSQGFIGLLVAQCFIEFVTSFSTA